MWLITTVHLHLCFRREHNREWSTNCAGGTVGLAEITICTRLWAHDHCQVCAHRDRIGRAELRTHTAACAARRVDQRQNMLCIVRCHLSVVRCRSAVGSRQLAYRLLPTAYCSRFSILNSQFSISRHFFGSPSPACTRPSAPRPTKLKAWVTIGYRPSSAVVNSIIAPCAGARSTACAP